jgi:Phage integrase family
MPCHHRLETYLQDYIEASGIAGDREGPLFRTTHRRTGVLTDRLMTQSDAWRMLQRRARAAGVPTAVCNHAFRATGITAYLDNGGSLENAQAMAAHESPRTTKFYDRTDDQITLDGVEKIGIRLLTSSLIIWRGATNDSCGRLLQSILGRLQRRSGALLGPSAVEQRLVRLVDPLYGRLARSA